MVNPGPALNSKSSENSRPVEAKRLRMLTLNPEFAGAATDCVSTGVGMVGYSVRLVGHDFCFGVLRWIPYTAARTTKQKISSRRAIPFAAA